MQKKNFVLRKISKCRGRSGDDMKGKKSKILTKCLFLLRNK